MDKQGASSPSRAANERIWCLMKITLFHSKFQINTRAAYDDCHRAIIFGNENSCCEKDSNGGGDSLKNLSNLSNTRWATTFFNMVPFLFLMGKIIITGTLTRALARVFLWRQTKTLCSRKFQNSCSIWVVGYIAKNVAAGMGAYQACRSSTELVFLLSGFDHT